MRCAAGRNQFFNASRLREWRDLHRQLADAMGVRPALPDRDIHYECIHRSVLTGLLGHVARREERNTHKATGNRLTTLFPGSGLFARGKKPASGAKKAPEEKGKTPSQPQWIMAAEIVETSALYARTAASILPEWIADLGAHLCSKRYGDPYWDAKAGRVLATERTILSGLEIARTLVDYGRIEPKEATEIFIRGALIEAQTPVQLRFFSENQKLRVKMETALTRVRNHRALVLDEMLYRFYAARIEAVSSLHDLQRFVKARLAAEPDFLCATEEDLLGDSGADYDRDAFPEQVRLANTVLPLSYEYNPGDEKDGVTVNVPLPVARAHRGTTAMDGARNARRTNQHAAARIAKNDPQNIAAARTQGARDRRNIRSGKRRVSFRARRAHPAHVSRPAEGRGLAAGQPARASHAAHPHRG